MKTQEETERKREEFENMAEDLAIKALEGTTKVCFECGSREGKGKNIEYIVCDSCNTALSSTMGKVDKDRAIEKAELVVANGMEWEDVMNFMDWTMQDVDYYLDMFLGLGIKKEYIIELYEGWEGSNDGC